MSSTEPQRVWCLHCHVELPDDREAWLSHHRDEHGIHGYEITHVQPTRPAMSFDDDQAMAMLTQTLVTGLKAVFADEGRGFKITANDDVWSTMARDILAVMGPRRVGNLYERAPSIWPDEKIRVYWPTFAFGFQGEIDNGHLSGGKVLQARGAEGPQGDPRGSRA